MLVHFSPFKPFLVNFRFTYPLSLKWTEISSIGPKTANRFRKSALVVPSQIRPTYTTRRSSTCRCCLELVCCHLRGLRLRSADTAEEGFRQVRRFFCLGLRKSDVELELELELDSCLRRRFGGEFVPKIVVRDLVVIR